MNDMLDVSVPNPAPDVPCGEKPSSPERVVLGDEGDKPLPTSPRGDDDESPRDGGRSEEEVIKDEEPMEIPIPIVKPIIDEKEVFKDIPEKRVKEGRGQDKKERKKRPPMTEKQKEALAKGRAKAVETRRNRAKEKNDVKGSKILREKMEHEKDKAFLTSMTQEQIVELQQKAIEGYDTQRKIRKQKKKHEQQEHAKATRVNQTIQKSLQPDPDEFWGVCFQ